MVNVVSSMYLNCFFSSCFTMFSYHMYMFNFIKHSFVLLGWYDSINRPHQGRFFEKKWPKSKSCYYCIICDRILSVFCFFLSYYDFATRCESTTIIGY